MNRRNFGAVLALPLMAVLSLAAGPASAERLRAHDIDIDIIGDRGGSLPQHPVEHRGRSVRAYVQAQPGERYAVSVHNRSAYRIGVVIAVDGRNAISGKRSQLNAKERMYVLEPYQRQIFDGWRSGQNRINRFFFTEAERSYAGAWGDYSAMGVIAVAAFRERGEPRYRDDGYKYRTPHGESGKKFRHDGSKLQPAPGTGFGEEHWSPSRQVRFQPHAKAFAQHFLKYEWRSTLCELGVINCQPPRYTQQRNRFWPDDAGFTPYPPPRW